MSNTPPPPAPVPPEIVAQRQDMMDEDIEIVRHWVRETHSVTHIDANAISEDMARRIIIAVNEGAGEAVDAFARIARRVTRAPLPAEPLSDQLGSATWDDIEHSPAEPSSSESSGDVHSREALDEVAICRVALGINSSETIPAQVPRFGSIIVERAGNRRRIAPATENEEKMAQELDAAIAERDAEQTKRKETAKDFETAFRLVREENDRLIAERDEAKAISQKHGERTKELARQLEQRGIDLDAAHTKALAQEGLRKLLTDLHRVFRCLCLAGSCGKAMDDAWAEYNYGLYPKITAALTPPVAGEGGEG
jgi:hypothetical protein